MENLSEYFLGYSELFHGYITTLRKNFQALENNFEWLLDLERQLQMLFRKFTPPKRFTPNDILSMNYNSETLGQDATPADFFYSAEFFGYKNPIHS